MTYTHTQREEVTIEGLSVGHSSWQGIDNTGVCMYTEN